MRGYINCEDMLISLFVVIISQWIHMSNHRGVLLKGIYFFKKDKNTNLYIQTFSIQWTDSAKSTELGALHSRSKHK